jgi:hypothetical protein
MDTAIDTVQLKFTSQTCPSRGLPRSLVALKKTFTKQAVTVRSVRSALAFGTPAE